MKVASLQRKRSSKLKNKSQSLVAVKKMFKISMSMIGHMRNLWSDECFEIQNCSNMDVHVLKAKQTTKETKSVVKWINFGIYEALEKGFLEEVHFKIFIVKDSGEKEALEQYSFYVKEVTDGILLSSNVTAGQLTSSQAESKIFTMQDVRKQSISMIRELFKLNGILQPIPENRFLAMRLFYNANCPNDYIPQGFRVPVNTDECYFDKNLQVENLKIGSIKTGYHHLQMNIKTTMFLDEDGVSEPSRQKRHVSKSRTEMESSCEITSERKDSRMESSSKTQNSPGKASTGEVQPLKSLSRSSHRQQSETETLNTGGLLTGANEHRAPKNLQLRNRVMAVNQQVNLEVNTESGVGGGVKRRTESHSKNRHSSIKRILLERNGEVEENDAAEEEELKEFVNVTGTTLTESVEGELDGVMSTQKINECIEQLNREGFIYKKPSTEKDLNSQKNLKKSKKRKAGDGVGNGQPMKRYKRAQRTNPFV